MTHYDQCVLCAQTIAPGVGAAAFRGRMAHLSCWLEWREGRRESPQLAILVVDDDDGGRYATSRMLQHAGFEVIEAASGDAALRAVKSHPDLVLLDLQLPGMDGFEVCRRIKSDPETASVRVLPFTAVYLTDDDRQRALSVGADGYLVRPFTAAELVAAVNGLIGVR
jgi:CheY-like chemotaxis protein